jgi:hypothetical protein
MRGIGQISDSGEHGMADAIDRACAAQVPNARPLRSIEAIASIAVRCSFRASALQKISAN